MEDINATRLRTTQIIVSIADIKEFLSQGVTRRIGDPSYNAELGSIQEKYGMNKGEVAALFQDPRLKGLKVSVPKPSRILIAEDLPQSNEIPQLEAMDVRNATSTVPSAGEFLSMDTDIDVEELETRF